ncbi:MAG: hypothetical protein JW966_06155 [Anaerolineae bacterium]|nr:hypothetical protein [Anaerolineae bacterium]
MHSRTEHGLPETIQADRTLFHSAIPTCAAFRCPAQVLVIDTVNGPANIVINTVSLLLDRAVSVTSVDEHVDALRALDFYDFDLIVFGLDRQRPLQLALLMHLRDTYPDLALVAIGQHLTVEQKKQARYHGAWDVVDLPERAADLKALVHHLSQRYLHTAIRP